MSDEAARIHAAMVSLGNKGALLIGPSGAGKSDLAARFIMTPFQKSITSKLPALIADDQVILQKSGSKLLGSPPNTLKGKLELRHIGIVDVPFQQEAELSLVVELKPCSTIKRMPESTMCYQLLGEDIPMIELDPFEASSVYKLAIALENL